MKTIKIYAANTENYFVNPTQITYFYTKVLDKKTIIRLSCGKEIETDLTISEIQKLITEQ